MADRPRITPELRYEDPGAAVEFLIKAFGFRELERFTGPDGRIAHTAVEVAPGAQVALGGGGTGFKGPKQLGQVTQLLYILVDNVDAHAERAKRASAKIIEAPTDTFYGDRRYTVEDPEGHIWCFAQQVRTVSAEDMQREMKNH